MLVLEIKLGSLERGASALSCRAVFPVHVIINIENPFASFESGFLCIIALVVLELTLQTRLGLDSQKSACLCFTSAGVKGMRHLCLALTIENSYQYVDSCRIVNVFFDLQKT